MAYDANDPADKKIVDKLIKEALAARETELTEEHETDTAGLKKKNIELLAKLKKAEAGTNNDPEEVARLQDDLDKVQKTLKDAQKELKTKVKENEDLGLQLKTESSFAQNLLIDNGLTSALAEVGVAKEYLPAVKALMQPKAVIKVDGDKREVLIGDKPLAEHVNSWSQGDEGKPFIAAKVNGGSNAPGGQGRTGSGDKPTMKRSEYDAAVAQGNSNSEFFSKGGLLIDG